MNMSNVKRNDGDIILDLKEIVWRLLEQWKAIVIFAVIIALAFSGLMYMRSSKRTATPTVPQTFDEILETLSAEDQKAVMGVLNEKEARDTVQEYLDDSLLMKIDPYNAKTLAITWAVNSDEDLNKQIVAEYMNEIYTLPVAQAINEAWGNKYDSVQVRELLTPYASIPLESESEQGGNIMKVVMYMPDGEDADAAASALIKSVEDMEPGIRSKVAEHKITLLSVDSQVITSDVLGNQQYNVYARFYNMSNHVNNLRDKLTSSQKSVYESLIKAKAAEGTIDEAAAEEVTEKTPAKPKFFSKKKFVLGLMLGCIAYAGLYLLYFLLSKKVRGTKLAEEIYGVRTLGEWHSGGMKGLKGLLFKDPFVYKLHHKGHMNMDAEVKRVSETIANSFADGEGSSLLLVTDCSSSESAGSFIGSLKSLLKERGVSVADAGIDLANGIYLSEDAVKSSDALAMILEGTRSSLKSVEDVCEKSGFCGKPMLGAAYVE